MFKRIVVGMDFNEPSLAALEYARRLAKSFGASISVLHVLQPIPNEVYAYSADVFDNWERASHDRLLEQFPAAERTVFDGRADVRVGSAAEEIVSYAAEQKADLIVLGTHGRGPIRHLFLGSVAERVVRLAPCPVLTVGRVAAGALKAPAAEAAVTAG
jgi:nucleotide-binding universal stress UspA family protein